MRARRVTDGWMESEGNKVKREEREEAEAEEGRGGEDGSRFRAGGETRRRRMMRLSHPAGREVAVLQCRLHALPVCREHPADAVGRQADTHSHPEEELYRGCNGLWVR